MIENEMPEWKFITVTQDLNVYLGMHGFPTKYIGNLLSTETSILLEGINIAEPNYEFRAYYDLEKLPSVSSVLTKYGDPVSTKMYRGWESLLVKMLDTGTQKRQLLASITQEYADTSAYSRTT